MYQSIEVPKKTLWIFINLAQIYLINESIKTFTIISAEDLPHDVHWSMEKPVYKPHPHIEKKNMTLLPLISRGI